MLYHNWWPLLTAVTYVVAPMPVLFLSAGDADGYSSMGGADSWEDLAKFLVGARSRARSAACSAQRSLRFWAPLP